MQNNILFLFYLCDWILYLESSELHILISEHMSGGGDGGFCTISGVDDTNVMICGYNNSFLSCGFKFISSTEEHKHFKMIR